MHEKDAHGTLLAAWSGSELWGGPHFYFEADDGHKMGLTDAGAGVPEYWIVDLVHGRLEVFREPQPEARRYASKMVLEAGARLEPGAVVSTDDLLPPPADT